MTGVKMTKTSKYATIIEQISIEEIINLEPQHKSTAIILLSTKKHSVFFVAILIGFVGGALFKMLDLIRNGEPVLFIFLHVGLMLSLGFSAWMFNKICELIGTIDRYSANEYLYEKDDGLKSRLIHKVYISFLCAFDLTDRADNVAELFRNKLVSVRRMIMATTIGVIFSVAFLCFYVILNITA